MCVYTEEGNRVLFAIPPHSECITTRLYADPRRIQNFVKLAPDSVQRRRKHRPAWFYVWEPVHSVTSPLIFLFLLYSSVFFLYPSRARQRYTWIYSYRTFLSTRILQDDRTIYTHTLYPRITLFFKIILYCYKVSNLICNGIKSLLLTFKIVRLRFIKELVYVLIVANCEIYSSRL